MFYHGTPKNTTIHVNDSFQIRWQGSDQHLGDQILLGWPGWGVSQDRGLSVLKLDHPRRPWVTLTPLKSLQGYSGSLGLISSAQRSYITLSTQMVYINISRGEETLRMDGNVSVWSKTKKCITKNMLLISLIEFHLETLKGTLARIMRILYNYIMQWTYTLFPFFPLGLISMELDVFKYLKCASHR